MIKERVIKVKKFSTVFLPVCICLLPVIFLSSCSDSQDNLIDTTTEVLVTEKTYKTSGICNDTVNWRYDASTSTFYFLGTGKIDDSDGIISDEGHWARIAENVRFEEGITDAEEHTFWYFNKFKTLYLPASYTGTLPQVNYIEKYIVDENNPKYYSDEYGVLFNRDKTEIIRYPQGSPMDIYEIPEGVTDILNGAFDGSKNLKTVIIPNSVNTVSRTTFEKSGIYINPENWEEDIFYAGDRLVKVDWDTQAENIIVKDGTRKIEAHAFASCDNIKSITIPDSVENIGAQAFESCSSLESIYIGSGVEEIGGAPFMFDVEGHPCISLNNIEVSKDNKNYVSVDGVLFNKEMTELIQYPIGKKQKEYIIPDSVTKLGYGAFCYCDELKKLTVGKGITEIDYCLLFGCDNIETVILPETLTKLDGGAFKYSGIKYIDIPDSVIHLGCEAMTGCRRLETVNIGKGVSYIHEWAISSSSLKKINVDPLNKQFSSRDGVLYNKDKTELIKYPSDKIGDVYRIPDSVKAIKCGAITQANNLDKIYVGQNIKTIEECNFYESVEDPELDFHIETNYEIYYNGTEKQWTELFIDEYEREHIDKSKIYYS